MAELPHPASLRYVDTQRLRMVAATARLVAIDLKSRSALQSTLGVAVPDNWPPEHHDRPAMQHALYQLEDPAEQGWSFWYLHSKDDGAQELIGICGFKGRPDARGSVEIGYSILSQFRNQGFASEAVQGLIAWAFSHPMVTEVCAETLPYLRQSIRVLEKSGFVPAGRGSEHGVARYALSRSLLR